MIELSKQQARRIVLKQMGLHKKSPFGRGKNAVLRTIEKLGYVQIDTISVVERAHHHVLWSRNPGYLQKHLHTLIAKEKRVIEYWAHAAAYLPMRDYRHTLVIKQYFKDQKDRWPKPDRKIMKRVYEAVESEGPMMARDFADVSHRASGWWDWKPAKWALERLFLEGELVVTERRGFQKVYDLPERCIPSDIVISHPTPYEHARYLIGKALDAQGIVSLQDICYLRKGVKKSVEAVLSDMVSKGEVEKVKIGRITRPYYFATPEILTSSSRIAKTVKLISPFDNLVIQRKRLRQLFNFDYQIECYVPRPKRKFGYFALPILFQDRFVGRADCKADRRSKEFHVYNLAMEKDVKFDELFIQQLFQGIREFATFNNCMEVKVYEGSHPDLVKELNRKLQ